MFSATLFNLSNVNVVFYLLLFPVLLEQPYFYHRAYYILQTPKVFTHFNGLSTQLHCRQKWFISLNVYLLLRMYMET